MEVMMTVCDKCGHSTEDGLKVHLEGALTVTREEDVGPERERGPGVETETRKLTLDFCSDICYLEYMTSLAHELISERSTI